jgi:hypothetical protein
MLQNPTLLPYELIRTHRRATLVTVFAHVAELSYPKGKQTSRIVVCSEQVLNHNFSYTNLICLCLYELDLTDTRRERFISVVD